MSESKITFDTIESAIAALGADAPVRYVVTGHAQAGYIDFIQSPGVYYVHPSDEALFLRICDRAGCRASVLSAEEYYEWTDQQRLRELIFVPSEVHYGRSNLLGFIAR